MRRLAERLGLKAKTPSAGGAEGLGNDRTDEGNMPMLFEDHKASQGTNGHAKAQQGAKEPVFTAAMTPGRRRAEQWLSDRLRRMGKAGRWIEEATITPELAELLLARHNGHNRAVRRMVVSRLARVISNGRWRTTHQGLALGTDGNLVDGQHRLLACVEAGVPIRVFIMFGADPADFDAIDTHTPRGNKDALRDEKHPGPLAAAVRLLVNLDASDFWNRGKLDNDEVLPAVERYDGLRDAILPGNRCAKRLSIPNSSATAAYWLIKDGTRRPERLDDFWDRLCTGRDLKSRSPILVFREAAMAKKLAAQAYRASGAVQIALLGSIIVTWNKWVSNSRSGEVSWTQAEPFPRVE